ncbi:MAG: STAS domain-containing protein [Nibricoccus sp.]
MPRTPNFEVTVNTAANQVRIHLSGDIDASSMKACVDEVARLGATVSQGFKVLTDLGGIKSMDASCVPEVERLMDLCRDQGVDTIVRVIPKRSKEIGFNILSLFHYPKSVKIVTCNTLAEAERALG